MGEHPREFLYDQEGKERVLREKIHDAVFPFDVTREDAHAQAGLVESLRDVGIEVTKQDESLVGNAITTARGDQQKLMDELFELFRSKKVER